MNSASSFRRPKEWICARTCPRSPTGSTSSSTRPAAPSRPRSRSASKVQELMATGQYSSATSGDFSDEGLEYQGYRWETMVSAWNQPGVSQQDIQPQTLEQFDLKVTWTGRTGPQSFVISTLVYSNPPLGPGAQPIANTAQKRGPSMGNVTGGS